MQTCMLTCVERQLSKMQTVMFGEGFIPMPSEPRDLLPVLQMSGKPMPAKVTHGQWERKKTTSITHTYTTATMEVVKLNKQRHKLSVQRLSDSSLDYIWFLQISGLCLAAFWRNSHYLCWKSAQKTARSWPTARTTSVQILAWTASS